MVVLISVTFSGLLRDMAVMHMLHNDVKVHARGSTSGSRPLMPSTMLMTCTRAEVSAWRWLNLQNALYIAPL